MQNNNSPFVKIISGSDSVTPCFQQTSLVALVFTTSWCPSCKMFKPILSQMAQKNQTLVIGFVNVQQPQNYPLSNKFQISSIPAVYLFQNSIDQMITKFVGANIQKANQMIQMTYQIIQRQPIVPVLKKQQWFCPNNHSMSILSTLPSVYPNNTFQCDQCRKVTTASEKSKMFHCNSCNYDLCNNCTHQ